jgi:hypothetical protein
LRAIDKGMTTHVSQVPLVALVTLACALACGGAPSYTRIEPRVASSTEAQQSLAKVQDAWMNLNRGTIKEVLRARCRGFLQAFPNDSAAPLVRVYLAIALLGGAEDRAVLALLSQNSGEREGTTRDLMDVVRGHLMRKEGRPEAALEITQPLVGKMVDPIARTLLLEEVTRASIESHRDFEVIATMDAWLQDATGDEHDRVRASIQELLNLVPEEVLESTYKTIRTKGKNAGYSLDIRRAIVTRMSQLALARGDAVLARTLLEGGGAAADTALQELASSTRGIRTVRGRTIGIVIPADDATRHDDAAEVVRGLSWALGLSESEATAREGVRLVTRSASLSGTQFEQALEELAGEGASIVIGGFEEQAAARLLAWSVGVQMSVIALASPGDSVVPTRGVILGESATQEAEALASYLTVQATPFSLVESRPPAIQNAFKKRGLLSPTSIGCDSADPGVSLARFPVAASDREGHDWVVEGPESCLHEFALDFAKAFKARSSGVVLTTLDTGLPNPDVRLEKVRFVTLATGILPSIRRLEEETDVEVRGYRVRFGSRPTYWSALGRDAGVLAKRATQPLPLDAATKDDAILHRRNIVEASLLAARQKFWSSDKDMVSSNRRLQRTLRIEKVTGTP